MAKKYPAVLVLFAVIAGIILSDNISIPAWIFLTASLIIFPLSLAAYYKGKSLQAGMVFLLAIIMLSAFGFSFRYRTFPPRHIKNFTDNYERYLIFGTVDDWPTIREHSTDIYLVADSIVAQGQTVRTLGRILLHIGTETTKFQYGDRMQFETQLFSIRGGKNPSGLDYRRYLNLKNIFAAAWLPHQYAILVDPAGPGYYMRLIDKLRKSIVDTFRATLSPRSAALASGFLIGETRDIPLEVYRLFRDSGTLHLLAVSGSNVALVLFVFIFLLRASPLTQRGRTIILLLVILIFSLLSYNQPSVVRASIMATLVLVGKLFQRKIDLNNIIAATALIILLVRPSEFFDIGFQLSFATAWGLIFFTPRIVGYFKSIHGRFYYKYLLFPIIICTIAQIIALPLIAYYFHRLPPISFISNLLIVPLASIIVIGEVVVLFGSLLLPQLGIFIGSLLDPLLRLTISLLEIFGSDKIAKVISFDLSVFQIITYYLILLPGLLSINSKKFRRLLLILILILANSFLYCHLISNQTGDRFTIFSGPGGTVSLNESKTKQLILSDLPLEEYFITEKTVLPYLNSRDINDFSIITLGGDYQVLKETVFLLSQIDSATAFIPISSKNLFYDISTDNNAWIDSTRFTFYDETPPPANLGDNEVILTDHFILYNFDSLMVFYLDNSRVDTLLPNFIRKANKLSIFIKAIFDESDINLCQFNGNRPGGYFICNRKAKSASEKIAEYQATTGHELPIIETSQVGAVELLIGDGRLKAMKSANYNIF